MPRPMACPPRLKPRRSILMLALLLPILLRAQPPSADSLAYAVNQFGFDYFRGTLQQAGPGTSFVCAPYTTHGALSLLAEGSGGATEAQLTRSLHLPSPGAIQDGLQAMQFYLNQPHMACTLSTASAIWPSDALGLNPEYIQRIQKLHQAQVRALPFAKDPKAARTFINQWVAERTRDHVTEILPEGAISPLSQVVLTSAVHFKGPWAQPFAEGATQEDIFFLADGGTVPVQYMRHREGMGTRRYGEHMGTKFVELPFEGDELAMTIIMNTQDDAIEWAARLDAQTWQEMRDGMWESEMDLWLPKFEVASGGSMRGILSALGLGGIFSEANLKRMLSERPDGLKVGDVLGKTTLRIAEGGVEASASTAVVVQDDIASDSDQGPGTLEFKADRPFVVVLHHKPSGVILFVGMVSDPSRKPD